MGKTSLTLIFATPFEVLAKEADLSISTIQRFMHGKSASKKTIKKLAKYADYTVEQVEELFQYCQHLYKEVK